MAEISCREAATGVSKARDLGSDGERCVRSALSALHEIGYEQLMRSLFAAAWLVPLVALGCAPTTAVVDGRTVPRLDLEFGGQPYAIRLSAAHPRPGGASSGLRDYGGRITGNVCGLDIAYEVQHEGDHLRLSGFIDDQTLASTIFVRDDGGVRRTIEGNLATSGGAVTLDLRYNSVRGNVGLRSFELGRQGDHYIGAVTIGQSVRALARINGADALWQLPPAVQAAVLPALLTCGGDELEDQMRGALVVGFGGEQSFEAKRVSSIYHVVTRDQASSVAQSGPHGQVFDR
jgi:hypothetical protein